MRTVPGKARKNGVAERMNRTLNERARSMRIHSGFPKTFWAVAVNNAAYLMNRGPSVPLKFKLPEGTHVLSLENFWLYCVCSRQSREKRDKLDAKAVKCYFIGYDSDMFGYKFWDDKNRKILRHCNVTVDEKILYKDKEKINSEASGS